MYVAVARRKVQIETSDENLRKLSELLKTLHSGEIDGQMVRSPIAIEVMTKATGVSRTTIYQWKTGTMMPQPANLRAIAVNLLRVREQDLIDYFLGVLSLRELLSLKPPSTTPDEVYRRFHLLPEADKDIVLALLLRDRSQQMGNVFPQKRSKTGRNTVFSHKGNSCEEDWLMASPLGEGFTPRAAVRLKNLLIASREKHRRNAGEALDIDEIAENAGIPPESYNLIAIEAAFAGQIGETYGPRFFPPEWLVSAAICFEPVGWRDDRPTGLTDRTFIGRVDQLKRSLIENGEPRRA